MISNPAATITNKIITAVRGMTSASGDVAYTGVGFKPSVIIAMAGDDGASTDRYLSNGFSDENLAMKCWYVYANIHRTAAAGLLRISAALGDYQFAVVKSFDADGFTLTWSKVGTPGAETIDLAFLCLR